MQHVHHTMNDDNYLAIKNTHYGIVVTVNQVLAQLQYIDAHASKFATRYLLHLVCSGYVSDSLLLPRQNVWSSRRSELAVPTMVYFSEESSLSMYHGV